MTAPINRGLVGLWTPGVFTVGENRWEYPNGKPLIARGPGGDRLVSVLNNKLPIILHRNRVVPRAYTFLLVMRPRVTSFNTAFLGNGILSGGSSQGGIIGTSGGTNLLSVNYFGPAYVRATHELSFTNTWNINRNYVVVGIVTSNRRAIYIDGGLVAVATTPLTPINATETGSTVLASGNGDGTQIDAPTANWIDILNAGAWAREFTPVEIQAISANPWLPYYRPDYRFGYPYAASRFPFLTSPTFTDVAPTTARPRVSVTF